MAELSISASGEVKLDYDIVGQITWAGPCAHLDVAGEWEPAGSAACWECGGPFPSDAAFDEVSGVRDDLEDERDELLEKVKKLEAIVAHLDRAVGNEPSTPSAAHD